MCLGKHRKWFTVKKVEVIICKFIEEKLNLLCEVEVCGVTAKCRDRRICCTLSRSCLSKVWEFILIMRIFIKFIYVFDLQFS